MGKQKTTEEFIKDAKKIHGDKYDYSKVEYKNAHTKVCIICPEHGEFWQTPANHLKAHGCPKCGKTEKSTNDLFIIKAKKVHGNKYDYSKVEYKNTDTKVCIICPEHGEFWQRPHDHLKNHGCPKCYSKILSKRQTYNTEFFVNKAKLKHENKYDYSKVEYINCVNKVCIICHKKDKYGNEHGEFWQSPYNHLYGQGCPKCKSWKMEDFISKILNDNNIKFEREKTFEWLIYKSKLRLDFYLPDYNIAIECQGEEHFEPRFFNHMNIKQSINEYKNTLIRDNIKKELCNKNGINILYYADYEYDFPYEIITNKEELLETILKYK